MKKEVKKQMSGLSIRFLRCAGLLILAVAITLVSVYLDARRLDPLMASYQYAPLVEYIFASSLIAVGGASLIELVEKKGRE